MITEREQLKKIVKNASERAVRENRALGLPNTYLEKGKIIKEYPNGSKEIIGVQDVTKPIYRLKKGTILHVKK